MERHQDGERLENLLWERRLRATGFFRLKRNFEQPPQHLRTGDRDNGARLFTVVYNRKMRDYRHKLKQEVLTSYKEKILHYEDDLALEQVIQRGIFVLSPFQDLAGQIPQQPGVKSEWTLL